MKNLFVSPYCMAGSASTSVIKLKFYPAKSESCKIKVLTQKPERNFVEMTLLNACGGQLTF